MFDIWENSFGGTDRFVRVLAAQAVSTFTAQQILDFQNAYLSADAYAIAPYFGTPLGEEANAGTTITLSVDEILDACEADLQNVSAVVSNNLAETSQRNLRLLAYEGGQHLRGRGPWQSNQLLTDKFLAANRSPRMGELYHDYFDIWRLSGGENLTLYTGVARFWRNRQLGHARVPEPADRRSAQVPCGARRDRARHVHDADRLLPAERQLDRRRRQHLLGRFSRA